MLKTGKYRLAKKTDTKLNQEQFLADIVGKLAISNYAFQIFIMILWKKTIWWLFSRRSETVPVWMLSFGKEWRSLMQDDDVRKTWCLFLNNFWTILNHFFVIERLHGHFSFSTGEPRAKDFERRTLDCRWVYPFFKQPPNRHSFIESWWNLIHI